MALEVLLTKQPYEVSFSGNPMPFSFVVTPYGDTELLQDIRLAVTVLVETTFNSGVYQEVKTQLFYPGSDGQILMDVRTIVHPYLEYYQPRLSADRPVPAPHQRKRYKVRYLLQKDGLAVGTTQESAELYALKGGMAEDRWHPTEFFSRAVLVDKKPLQHAPGRVFLDQKLFFFWVYPLADNAEQSIRVNMVHTAGTSAYTLAQTISCGKWGVCCTPAGFHQMGLSFLIGSADHLISYTITVLAGSTVIAQSGDYEIEYRTFYQPNHLLYRNSLGGVEALVLRGQVDFEAEYSRSRAQLMTPPAYFANTIQLAQSGTASINESPKYKGDTGWLKRAAAEGLRDLFRSPSIYEVSGSKLLPVEVMNKTVKFYSNRDNLISVLVEWQRAYTNDYFTPAGLMPTTRTCPAVEKLELRQISKKLLQVIYALQIPYDRVQVQITYGLITYTYYYSGNTGAVKQVVDIGANQTVTVSARTVCDGELASPDLGPVLTKTIAFVTNNPPVANNDTYNINNGFTQAVTLSPSVLANDYDPDGDGIEAIAASGATNAGGSFSINAAGVVQYTPPSSSYTGQDWFDYQVKETSGAITVSARVFINVGQAPQVIYVKKVTRNVTNGDDFSEGEVWFDFFVDTAAQQPIDVTGLGLVINYEERNNFTDANGNPTFSSEDKTIDGTGKKVQVYVGTFSSNFPGSGYQSTFINLKPGTGYTVL